MEKKARTEEPDTGSAGLPVRPAGGRFYPGFLLFPVFSVPDFSDLTDRTCPGLTTLGFSKQFKSSV